MTPQEIIDNNILLAEFMGWETKDIKQMVLLYDYSPNRDWNQLMPIVQNINLIDNYNYTVQINSMDVNIHSDGHKELIVNNFSPYGVDELIKGVYEACTAFVKWYNQNKGGK